MTDEAVEGKLMIGYAPGMVVIDVQAGEKAVMTTISKSEDLRSLIETLEECGVMAFTRKAH